MATIQRFEDLEIWQLARMLENKIFALTKNAPLAKDFSLKDQINRSSGSVMDNIAEGYGRGSRLEFIQFLSIASGSADEVKSQLYRCLDREYILKEKFDELYNDAFVLNKKINGFMKYLNTTATRGTKFKDRTK